MSMDETVKCTKFNISVSIGTGISELVNVAAVQLCTRIRLMRAP